MTENLKKSKGNIFLIVVIILAVALTAFALWWFIIKKPNQQNNNVANDTNKITLTKVTYTSQNPSLPPQYSQAKTVTYTSQADIDKINSLLKANNISKVSQTESKGCTGGINYEYKLIYSDDSMVEYKEYKCANTYTGNMGGNVANFITSFSKDFDK